MNMENKTTTIYDCINAIKEKIPTYKYNKKSASAYMLLLWFSHLDMCMPHVDRLNERLFDMPDELVFSALFKSVPRGRRFIKWDKGVKDKALSKKKEDAIKEMMDEHGFSKFEASTVYKRYIDS